MLYSIEDMPKWDEALEAVLVDRYHDQKRCLTIKDLQKLAVHHHFRVDDILETLLELVSYGRWEYQNHSADDNSSLALGELVQQLAKKRLNHDNLSTFQGSWSLA